MTVKDRAAKKVQISIDKMVELREDFQLKDLVHGRISKFEESHADNK